MVDRLGSSSTWQDVAAAVGPRGDLSGKTCIITGCNTGIGKETARAIASMGANTVFACRSREKADAAAKDILAVCPSAKVATIPIDLASLPSIRSFCDEFLRLKDEQKWPPLSILILNAGIVSSTHKPTEGGIESMFGTNHLGNHLLTQMLLPTLRAAHAASGQPSRVVTVASDAHFSPLSKDVCTPDALMSNVAKCTPARFAMMKSYGSSKLANVQFSARLHRTEAPAVVACSLHPGTMIGTDIARDNGVIAAFLAKYVLGMFTKSLAQGAATTVLCAVDRADRLNGGYFCDCQEKRPSALAQDERAQDALWEVSEQLCRL